MKETRDTTTQTVAPGEVRETVGLSGAGDIFRVGKTSGGRNISGLEVTTAPPAMRDFSAEG